MVAFKPSGATGVALTAHENADALNISSGIRSAAFCHVGVTSYNQPVAVSRTAVRVCLCGVFVHVTGNRRLSGGFTCRHSRL